MPNILTVDLNAPIISIRWDEDFQAVIANHGEWSEVFRQLNRDWIRRKLEWELTLFFTYGWHDCLTNPLSFDGLYD